MDEVYIFNSLNLLNHDVTVFVQIYKALISSIQFEIFFASHLANHILGGLCHRSLKMHVVYFDQLLFSPFSSFVALKWLVEYNCFFFSVSSQAK